MGVLFGVGVPAIEACRVVIRLELQSAVVIGERLSEVAEPGAGVAAIVVGGRRQRIEADRFRQVRQRFVEATLIGEGVAAIDVRQAETRIERKRSREVGDGLLEIAVAQMQQAAVVVDGGVRLDLQRFGVVGDGQSLVAALGVG